MSGFAIRGKIDGLGPLLRRLDGLKRGARNRILRPAVRIGASIENKAAKAAVRPGRGKKEKRRNGLLRKSLGVKMLPESRGSIQALIGPRRGFKAQTGVRTRGGKKSKKGDPVYEDPANIAHLVEFGHGGPHPAPPQPFMGPAFVNNKARIRQAMADRIADGLAQLARG